jgi:predicted  nucleic acid-binding Zn-ribbon protein
MHQCIRCNSQYGDDNKELLSGCSCGSKLFFYVRGDVKLSDEQQNAIRAVAESQQPLEPSVISLEAIRVDGDEFIIDLEKLFAGGLVITKLDEAYTIDFNK